MKVTFYTVDSQGTPTVDSDVTIDEKSGSIAWGKESEMVKELLDDDIYLLGGEFDPTNIDHWKALPYVFQGHRFYAELEGAEPVHPQWWKDQRKESVK